MVGELTDEQFESLRNTNTSVGKPTTGRDLREAQCGPLIGALYDLARALENMRGYGVLKEGQYSVLLNDPEDGMRLELAAEQVSRFYGGSRATRPLPDVLVEIKAGEPMVYRQLEFHNVRFLSPTHRYLRPGGGFEDR
jgi:hypothetical protein